MELEVPRVEDMVNDGIGVQANLPEFLGLGLGCRVYRVYRV